MDAAERRGSDESAGASQGMKGAAQGHIAWSSEAEAH